MTFQEVFLFLVLQRFAMSRRDQTHHGKGGRVQTQFRQYLHFGHGRHVTGALNLSQALRERQ